MRPILPVPNDRHCVRYYCLSADEVCVVETLPTSDKSATEVTEDTTDVPDPLQHLTEYTEASCSS